MNLLESIELKTVELIKRECAYNLRVSEGALEVEAIRHDAAREIVFRLRAHIFGEDLHPIYIQYPKNWWQAFKKCVFNPGFLELICCQVEYKVWVVSGEALYPLISVPDEQATIRFAMMEHLSDENRQNQTSKNPS